jgi:1,4-dihydroxy-2-naphthoate octaprenyltransferase
MIERAQTGHAAPETGGERFAIGRWIMAIRPRTLGLSISPVVVGTCLAWAKTGRISWLVFVAAAMGGVLIQVGTNLYNDAADFERGGDGPDRVGPPRATALGLLPAREVKAAALLSFGLAAVCGLFLASVGGWPIVLLGLMSILAGLAYSAGPLPISHTPFGEVFVIAFFGLGAVCGTYWLQTLSISRAALLAGTAIGLFAAAVLLVNNHRDVASDKRAGRRTLAMLIGPRLTLVLYAVLIMAPVLVSPFIFGDLSPHRPWGLVYVALLPAALLLNRFAREPPGRGLNLVLQRTAQLQAAYAALICLTLIM